MCSSDLKVVFGLDRSGIVGADGETHQGLFDIPLLRHIPNMTIVHPRNPVEAFKLLNYAFKVNTGPLAIRYERGNEYFDFSDGITNEAFDKPEWEIINKGKEVVFLSFGSMLERVKAEVLKQKLDVCIVDAKFIKPLDKDIISYIKIGRAHV